MTPFMRRESRYSETTHEEIVQLEFVASCAELYQRAYMNPRRRCIKNARKSLFDAIDALNLKRIEILERDTDDLQRDEVDSDG